MTTPFATPARAPLPRRRITTPGAPPGTLVEHPGAHPTRWRVMAYGPERCDERDDGPLEEALAAVGGSPVVWLDVVGLADVAATARIGEALGLHPLVLEDVVNAHQRPKVEAYDDQLFVVARTPPPAPGEPDEQISLVFGPGYVVTFQERPGDCFDGVRERIRHGGTRIRAGGPDYLAYALLDAVVDAHFPVLERIGEDIEALELEVLEHPETGAVARIHALKRALLALRRDAWPLREVFAELERDDSGLVRDPTRPFLRDCYDHSVQLVDMLETYRDITTGLLDVYLSSVNTRMNEVMKVLTIIATVFIPLGFIASVYGMNFDRSVSPWNMPELGWAYGYPFALGLMVLVAAALLAWFRRRAWIGSRERP